MVNRRSVVVEKLAAAWPPERWRDVTVLVAISGGADSVALLRALLQARAAGLGRFVLAHYNHRLRGPESDADQSFVEDLARQWGIDLIVGQATHDLAGGTSGEGLEGAARQARYAFLAAAADQSGARYVATAHTADDQVETVLHNIIRGTGLAGLAGIPRFRRLTAAACLVRPLLDVSRAEVLEYLQSLHQPYREDSTNELIQYTRNRIRHTLLPLLEREFNPHVRLAVLRLAKIAAEALDRLDQEAAELLRSSRTAAQGAVEIQAGLLAAAHPAVVRQALAAVWQEQDWPMQEMSLEKWEQLRQMIQPAAGPSPPSIGMFPGGVRAERSGGKLRLRRVS